MNKMALLAMLAFGPMMFAQTPMVAQTPPAPPTRGCPNTTVITKTSQTLSPQLHTYLNTLHPAGYNLDSANHNFGDSVRICPCEVCSAMLEIRVKPTHDADIPQNDGYTVGVAPFGHSGGGFIANGNVWPQGTSLAEKTITINLNPQQLSRILCDQKPDHWLDVYVQDDTMVKWIKLTLTHP